VSRNPFPLYPEASLSLPPAYLGDIARYAAIAACAGNVTIMGNIPWDKRMKSLHRCSIASTRGAMTLTLPVAKPSCSHTARWSDILISPHDDWWKLHLTALESAYGRTPFFEFYIDRLAPFFADFPAGRLVDFNASLECVITSILGLPEPRFDNTTPTVTNALASPVPTAEPYWQVRAHILGFIPGMSILDLIFNMGPEAPCHLARIAADCLPKNSVSGGYG